LGGEAKLRRIDSRAGAFDPSIMILFHLPNGNPVAISPLSIFCIHQDEGGTLIVSLGGSSVLVREPFEEVEARLKAWTKA
jgi:hypothetical protein